MRNGQTSLVEPPERDRERRSGDDRHEQRDGGERLRVAGACKQEIPARVDDGRRQRKRECLGRQGYPRRLSRAAPFRRTAR